MVLSSSRAPCARYESIGENRRVKSDKGISRVTGKYVGLSVEGVWLGAAEGLGVGDAEVGVAEGAAVVGVAVGAFVGGTEGVLLGLADGSNVGTPDGETLGMLEGLEL